MAAGPWRVAEHRGADRLPKLWPGDDDAAPLQVLDRLRLPPRPGQPLIYHHAAHVDTDGSQLRAVRDKRVAHVSISSPPPAGNRAIPGVARWAVSSTKPSRRARSNMVRRV